MTRQGIGERWVIIGVLAAAALATASVQVVHWVRRPRLPISDPSVVEPVVSAQRDTTPPVPRDTVGPTTAPIAAAAVSPTGRLVATLDDSGEVIVWDLRTRTQIGRFASELKPSRDDRSPLPIAVQEALGPGVRGPIVAIGGADGNVGVWNARTGRRLLAASHSARDAASGGTPTAPVIDVELTVKGRLVTLSGNGSLAFWTERQPDGELSLAGMSRGPGGTVRDVDISPGGVDVAVATDDALYLSTMHQTGPENRWRSWRVLDRRPDATPRLVRFGVGYSRMVSAWSDGAVRIYETREERLEQTFSFGERHPVRRLIAVGIGGYPLTATDGDRGVLIPWGGETVDTLTTSALRGPIRSIWFSSDDKHLVVSGEGDRYLRSVPLPLAPGLRPPRAR